MIAGFLRRAAAIMLFASGAAAVAQSLPAPPPGYTPPPTPWATFNFTNGSNSNVQDGNARIFSASSSLYGSFNVRVTAWSLEKVCSGAQIGSTCFGTTTTYVRDSKLMVYDGGLGIISGDDGNGSNGEHTIDNEGRRDFLVFQFDRDVQLVAATFNTYSVNGQSQNDSDVTIKYGDLGPAWNSSLTSLLNDKKEADLNALFNGTYQSNIGNGSDNRRWINPDKHWGDMWMIGASFANPDSKIDGFKLENLSVVPEPATWAMMIAGFGAIGGAMRNGRREVALQA